MDVEVMLQLLVIVVAVELAMMAVTALRRRLARPAKVDVLVTDWGKAIHEAAEKHLAEVEEAEWLQDEAGQDFEVESPALAPFCGCQTCVVREVMVGAWPVIIAMLEAHKATGLDLEPLR